MEKSREAAEAGGKGGAKFLAEKDGTISELNEELATERMKAGEFKKQVQDLEKELQKAKSQPPPGVQKVKGETKMRPASGGGNMEEARFLAGDLDKSLASVSSQLAALTSRVKRLHDSLYRSGDVDGGRAGDGRRRVRPRRRPTAAPQEPEAPRGQPAEGEARALAEAAAETPRRIPRRCRARGGPDEELEASRPARGDARRGTPRRRRSSSSGRSPSRRSTPASCRGRDAAGHGQDEQAPRRASPLGTPAAAVAPREPRTTPRGGRSAQGEEPKKKGFFGKLFGKK
jgi:uncharacterized coiled-coil protein SlyX